MPKFPSVNEKRESRSKYPIFLFFFAVIVFWKLILTGEYSMLTYTDCAFQTYPWAQYIAGVLHQGSFPFWDPYSQAGRFFIGETQTGVFYPLNLLMGFFPLNHKGALPVSIIEYFAILHCFLASLLTYFLARELGLTRFSAFVSGIVFAYSGSIGGRAFSQINLLDSSVWVPAVFLFYSKSLRSTTLIQQFLYINLAGLSLALCLLAGHHQPFIYTTIAVICVAVAIGFSGSKTTIDPDSWQLSHQSLFKLTSLLFLFALGYCSLQLLPSLEYSPLAYRWVGPVNPILVSDHIPYSVAGSGWSLSPQGLTQTIFPYISVVENSPYIGILPLLFLIFSIGQFKKSKVVRIAWFIALLFLALSMGEYTPLHGLLYALVPGFEKGREASRLLLLSHLAFSVLVGFGCQAFFSPFPKKQKELYLRLMQAFGCLSVPLTALVFAVYFYSIYVLFQSTDYNVPFFACLWLMMTTALVICRRYGSLSLKALKIIVIMICLFDYHFVLGFHIKPKSAFDGQTNFEPKQYYHQDNVIEFLRSQPGTFRIDFREPSYPRSTGEVFRLETINGSGITQLKQFFDLLSLEARPGGRISDLFNVKYIVSREELQLPKVFESKGTFVYENPDCFPRAWLVDRVTYEESLEKVLVKIQEPSFDPHHTALIEHHLDALLNPWEKTLPDDETLSGSSLQEIPVHFTRESPNRFVVEAQAARHFFLVVSENWYPGWTAKVNGTPQPLMRANGALMGVFLNPGPSKVEFSFRPRHFYWALSLTMISLLTLVLASTLHLREMMQSERNRP